MVMYGWQGKHNKDVYLERGEQVMSHVYDTHEITHAATLDMSSRDSKFALSTAAAHFPPPWLVPE